MAKARKLFTIGYEQTPSKAVLDELEQAGVKLLVDAALCVPAVPAFPAASSPPLTSAASPTPIFAGSDPEGGPRGRAQRQKGGCCIASMRSI